jgi:hypothetical protein
MSADVAGEGEVWLSSQNRNFKNRMGKGKRVVQSNFWKWLLRHPGSIGHITSAAAVAASSFDMKITNPNQYLESIDIQRLRQLLSKSDSAEEEPKPNVTYVEPAEAQAEQAEQPPSANNNAQGTTDAQTPVNEEISGKIQRLGDFVDTDAVSCCG